MAKQTRVDRNEARRAAVAEAARRARVKRRIRTYSAAAGGGTVLVVLVILLLNVLGGGGTLPQGTQVFPETNHQHVAGTVHYNKNPPAGGAHDPTPLNCGVYAHAVSNEHAVHSLEHGSVWITYRPNLSASKVSQLRLFVEIHYSGIQRYLILSPYPGIPSPVVASAWGAQILLKGPSDPRLAAFVSHFIGGGQGGEKGAACTGGFGVPIG